MSLQDLFRRAPTGVAAAQALYHSVDRQIESEGQKRLAEASKAIANLPKGWERQLEDAAAFAGKAARMRARLRGEFQDAGPAPVPTPGRLRFQTSIAALRQSYTYLHVGAEGNERMHLVTGCIAPDGTRILSTIEPVAYASQSPGFVAAEPKSTHRKLINLCERDGLPLLAMYHSHVMRGAASTTPSAVDIANMRTFLEQGWDAIGGIFSLDGFVRFFSTGIDFDLSVYGHGAELVTETPRDKVFKFTLTE